MSTRHWRLAVLALAAATALACSGTPNDAKPLTAASSGAAAAPAVEQSKAPAVTYAVPVAADFALTVKILEKECFGTAGCLIKYRIVLKQANAKVYDPTKTYELTYTLKGTDQAEIGTLTITGDQYSADEYGRTGTKREKDKITAVVTEISES